MRKINANKLLIMFFFIGLRGMYGLPEGSEPTSGGGSISVEGSTMSFTAPDGSIFNHGSFNVKTGETVKFVQPSANARVLNRISSNSASTIDGRVEANGKLYFAAPGGLIFGEGAVIQARHLQAVAGNIEGSNWDKYPELKGDIENKGTIQADSIILGGRTVKNRGSLSAGAGSILLVAGGGMEISSSDGLRAVELSENFNSSESMAGDLLGHALLESGVLSASDVQVTASSVTLKGMIEASKLEFSEITELTATDGTIHASDMIVKAKANRFPKISLPGKNNQISNLSLDGSFSELKVLSSNALAVSSLTESTVSNGLQVQDADLRTSNGDLSLSISFSPISTITNSSLLLAAKTGSVEMDQREFLSGFDQVVVYGNNVLEEVATAMGTLDDDWYVLNATTLNFDTLTPGLDASSIFLLEAENASLNLTGSGQISGGTSNSLLNGSDNIPSVDPGGSTTISSGTSTGVIGEPGLISPVGTPSLTSFVTTSSSANRLTEQQLASAMSVGLYSDHSYLLQSIPPAEYTLIQLAEAGGTSLLFGGSFDTVAGGGDVSTRNDSSSADSGSEIEDASASSDEQESSDDKSAKGGASEGQSPVDALDRAAVRQAVLGAAPLAPISRPVFSPLATQRLEQALTPEIEESLKGFSNR